MGLLLALVATIAFATRGIFGVVSLNLGYPLQVVLFWRFFFAALFLGLWVLIKSPQQLLVSLRDLRSYLLLGAFFYTGFSYFYFKTIEDSSVSVAVLLLFTYPMITLVLESRGQIDLLSAKEIVAIVVTFFLLLLFFNQSDFQLKLSTVALGLAAALLYSVYMIHSRKNISHKPAVVSAFYVTSFVSLSLFFWTQKRIVFSKTVLWEDMGFFAGFAFVATVLPIGTMLAALRRLSASRAASINMTEPFIASVFAFFIFGESLNIAQWFILLIIVFILMFIMLQQSKDEAATSFSTKGPR